MCPGPVFRWEFNGSVHFVIGLTIFGNIFVLYVCICIIVTGMDTLTDTSATLYLVPLFTIIYLQTFHPLPSSST
jgi:hypothetical protein